ncbi:hypothetical protein ACO0RG_000370 [Hanseniaspora osmophila]
MSQTVFDTNVSSGGSQEKFAYPVIQWDTTFDIPLKDSDEVVSIDLVNDLPPDPNELTSLLIEENANREHWLRIAIAYCNQNKLKEGIKLIELALDVFQGPLSSQLHTFLTWAYLSLTKKCGLDQVDNRKVYLQKSEQHLKSAIDYEPTWIGNMLATIDIYYQRKQYDKALETAQLFSKAIVSSQPQNSTKSPQQRINVLFLLLKAKVYYQKKNYTASLKLFQELLILNPVLQPDSRIGIGLCFWQLKDHDMAIKSWKRSLELNPNNEAVKILVLLSEFHNSLHKSGNDTEFFDSYTKYLQDLNSIFETAQKTHDEQVANSKEFPEYQQVEEVSPVLYCLLQNYFYLKGDHNKVVDIYNKVLPFKTLVTKDLSSEISFWCGRAHYALKDYKSAFQMFQESLKNSDEHFLSRFGLGQSQYENNLVEEALLTFENMYKTNESIQELNYVLGILYSSKIIGLDTTKSQSSSTGNNKSGAQNEDVMNKAFFFLEKYIRLTRAKKNQLINLNAYLVLSQLYEIKNLYDKSLHCLNKVVEQLEYMNETIPLEVYNNMACYYFSLSNMEKAQEFFGKAKDASAESISALTIDYNIARTSEETDGTVDFAVDSYTSILKTNPSYITARMRNIFLDYVKGERGEKLESEIEKLMSQDSSDLEVRSLYSWFLKNVSSKKVDDATGELLESKHNKETLTEFDSHDMYALISLANVYVNVARNAKRVSKKSPKEFERIKHSYIKAVHLYSKVLTLDSYNVFAAQGLAICLAENGMYTHALDLLKKIRDSLNVKSVFMNMGHCLTELGEYIKAVDSYSEALANCEDDVERSDVYNLLGRVWLLKGLKESNLEFIWKSLEYVEKASSNDVQFDKFKANLKYNRASLFITIGNMVCKLEPIKRSLKDLQKVDENLLACANDLNSILEDAELVKFFSREDLKHKCALLESSLKEKIGDSIQEQEAFEGGVVKRLEEARHHILAEEERSVAELKAQEEQDKLRKQKDAEEFKKLQEAAQKLIQERAEMIQNEDDKDQDLPIEEDGEFDEGKTSSKRKRGSKDSASKKKKQKKRARIEDDEEEEEEYYDDEEVPSSKSRSKKSTLSNEFINDSDVDADSNPDDLFGDEDEGEGPLKEASEPAPVEEN